MRPNYGNQLPEQLLELLGKIESDPSITSINLAGSNISREGLVAIAEILESNKNITSVELGLNYIGNEGARIIAGALKKNTSLTRLDLDFGNIGDEGGMEIAGALKKNKSIVSMDLSGNAIGDEVTKEISEALEKNKKYQSNFFSAVSKGDQERAKLLLDKGVSINGHLKNKTPIQVATGRRNLDMVFFLTKEGAKINAKKLFACFEKFGSEFPSEEELKMGEMEKIKEDRLISLYEVIVEKKLSDKDILFLTDPESLIPEDSREQYYEYKKEGLKNGVPSLAALSLDEIVKGTNSTEDKSFKEKLVKKAIEQRFGVRIETENESEENKSNISEGDNGAHSNSPVHSNSPSDKVIIRSAESLKKSPTKNCCIIS